MGTMSVMRVPMWLWGGVLTIAVIAAGMAFVPQAAAQEPPTFTDPTEGGHLSLGTDDADDTAAGFQYRIRGTAEAGAEVEVSAGRPDGSQSSLGTTTADDQGNWDLVVTFDEPGEYDLQATQTTAEGTSDPAEIRIFIVLRYVFTFYDDVNSAANWVTVSNPGDQTARAEIFVDGQQRGDTLVLDSGQLAAPRFRGVIGGPVVVDSLDGRPLVTTQRTTWSSGDLEEVAGVYDGHLSEESWFTWYDTVNTRGRDWVVVTNFGDSRTTAEVTVGGTSLGSQAVDPGRAVAFKRNGTIGGPVRVTADEPILASRRTLWKPTNFVELVGTPGRWLAREHNFPWFDAVNTNNADWLMVSNPHAQAIDVRMELPDRAPTEFELGPGEVTARQFPGAIGGPISVQTELPAAVTQRALWSGARSFEEVASVPAEELTSTYWHTVYDKVNARGDWLLQASTFPADDEASPDVPYRISAPCIDHVSTLEPGEVEAPQFNGAICGTVVVGAAENDDGVRLPFLQSKRTLWRGAKRDFMEFAGLRGTHLGGRASQVAAPGDVAVEDVENDDGTNLDISWAAVDDPTVDGYWVYRVLSEDPLVEQRVAYTPQDQCETGLLFDVTCTARDFGLTPGEEYTYKVRALSLATVEGVRATGGPATPTDEPPSAPTWPDEGATEAGDDVVHLDWNDNPEVEEVVGYHVWVAEDPSQPPNASACATLAADDYTQDTSVLVTESEHTVTGLTSETRYCFEVTAMDAADQQSERSEERAETPVPIPPEVTVTAPNGGEVLRGDGSSTFEITWTDDDPDGNKDFVRIWYTANADSPSPTWVSITDFTDNDGSFVWNPPAIDSQTVRVRVRATDEKENQDEDVSDANFAIDSATPALDVTSPVEGDRFAAGDPITVSFDYTEQHPEDTVVERSVDGGPFETITCTPDPDPLAPGSDSAECDWTAPGITSENVVVRVTIVDSAGHSGSDTSAAFAIDSTAPPSPVIAEVDGDSTSPAKGTDDSPPVVVTGGSPFTEDGTVKVYAGPPPSSCNVDPTGGNYDGTGATREVTEGQENVTFNDPEGSTDFTFDSDGNKSLWACMEDLVGNDSGISAEFKYELDTQAPSQVTGLSAEGGPNEATLTWDANNEDDLAGYNVYRAQAPNQSAGDAGCGLLADGDYSKVNDQLVTDTTFTDSPLTSGTRYCYQVTAVDDVGNEGDRSAPDDATAS